jgi:4-amino-4-deoxy-L-arabinose transferase-like glycosyltransferase
MQQRMEKLKSNYLDRNYHIIALALIATLSFFLNFYAISNNGTGNEYYAACVKSMTQSFHNFFFVSFDPSGMVSVDKPPLGLWTQAISVLIFGYHGWAMLLPQALAGTASCLMIYILTAKYFGRTAGLLSSLIFALTPVIVVVSRNNTMDMQLVFVLLVAAWLLFRSISSGKWRYLFLTAVFVGLGFNIKMLQAYMILPAVVITYLFFAKEKLSRRFLAGVISVIIMLAVSFAWVLTVELVPSSSRPYVDSTSNNSMLELITGHNGTERLFGSGSGGGMGGGFGGTAQADGKKDGGGTPPSGKTDTEKAMLQGNGDQNETSPQMHGGEDSGQTKQDGRDDGRDGRRDFDGQTGQSGFGGQGGFGQGGGEIGSASAIRLWTSNLYGQSSWLLLFAVCSIFGCLKIKLLKKKDIGQASIVFWSLWLITMVIFFSFAGFYHRYYLCMMAPAIAVLSGVGIVTMYRSFKAKQESRKEYIRPAFLLIAFLANIALEVKCVLSYSALKTWLLPVILAAAAAGILLLLFYIIKKKRIALVLSTVALLISALAAPFYWALTPVLYVSNTTMPYAGPELAGTSGGQSQNFAGNDGGNAQSSGLEQYLVKNYKEGSFLVVSQRSNDVAQYIIDTGLPCYAYGGFLGSDNSLTLDGLKKLVTEGKITYFLVSSQNGGGGSNSELISYVKSNAKLIDSSEYSSGDSTGRNQGGSLYLFK